MKILMMGLDCAAPELLLGMDDLPPIEPGCAVGDVPGDQHRQGDRYKDPAVVHQAAPLLLPARSNRAQRESVSPELRTDAAPKTTVS